MTLRSMDNPWRRLPWTLPTALLIWAAALWGLTHLMENPVHRPVGPPPIEVALLEQAASTPSSPGNSNVQGQLTEQPEPPAPAPPPKPIPTPRPRQAPVMPKVNHHARPKPPDQKAETATNATGAVSDAAAPGVGQATDAGNASANSGAQSGSLDQKGSSRGNIYANSAARAIIQPLPQIPEDLRTGAFISSALVRFHIAVDGSAEVELAKPTQDPRLNRMLLDCLKKWRFMPAIKGGKPVTSTEEILVKMQVK